MKWLWASPLVIRVFAVFFTIDKVNALMKRDNTSELRRNTQYAEHGRNGVIWF